jgi:hypothetical protein
LCRCLSESARSAAGCSFGFRTANRFLILTIRARIISPPGHSTVIRSPGGSRGSTLKWNGAWILR